MNTTQRALLRYRPRGRSLPGSRRRQATGQRVKSRRVRSMTYTQVGSRLTMRSKPRMVRSGTVRPKTRRPPRTGSLRPQSMQSYARVAHLRDRWQLAVYAQADGTLVGAARPLLLEDSPTISSQLALYERVHLDRLSVHYEPEAATSDRGTVSVYLDPNPCTLKALDLAKWETDRNPMIKKNRLMSRSRELTLNRMPEYAHGGFIPGVTELSALLDYTLPQAYRSLLSSAAYGQAASTFLISEVFGHTLRGDSMEPLFPVICVATEGYINGAVAAQTLIRVGILVVNCAVSLSNFRRSGDVDATIAVHPTELGAPAMLAAHAAGASDITSSAASPSRPPSPPPPSCESIDESDTAVEANAASLAALGPAAAAAAPAPQQ